MIINQPISPSLRKKINMIPAGHAKKDIFLVLNEENDHPFVNSMSNQRVPTMARNEGDDFKSWNMPEQPHGYIKAKKRDLL